MKTIPLAAGFISLGLAAWADTPTLTVYTYDSFASEWGPGPAIEKGFEEGCGCDLRFVTAGDGAALLSRLQLEGPQGGADVVVGLDTNLTDRATATGLFAPHGQPPVTALPVAVDDPVFLPFDWGWFAFVHDRSLANPPRSLTELAASDLRVLVQDPRSSTPGLGLVMWVKAAHGDNAGAIWAEMKDNIVTVTPGWSEAYGMFLEGEADMVLSYTTSPAYHLIAEQDDSKTAALFDEGHYLQVEVAAKLAATDQPALADAFLAYLVGPEAQGQMATTNWMYPANLPAKDLPKGFETLITPGKSLLLPADEAARIAPVAIAEWQAALAR